MVVGFVVLDCGDLLVQFGDEGGKARVVGRFVGEKATADPLF